MKKILFSFLILFSLFSVFGALTDNNVLYYSFDNDDVSGSTIIDLAGNYNGTCVNMTNCNTIAGKLINAGEFDGINEAITIADVSQIDGASALSWGGWINTDSVTGLHDIISKEGNTANTQVGTLRLNNNQIQSFFSTTSTDSFFNSVSTISTNTWYHVVAVYNGSHNAIWINGVLDSSIALTGILESNSVVLKIGKSGRNDLGRYWDGELDELFVYNRALNSSEISELYNSGNGFNPYNIDNNFITLNNLTANNETFINNSFYNTQNITFSLNLSVNEGASNPDTTMTVWKNKTIYYQETVNNNLTPSFNIDNFTDSGSRYNFSFYSINNVTNATFGNYTLIVDLTPPTINNSLPLEYNFYNINLSNYISCYDIETGTCNITFLLDGISVATNTTSYNFTYNGNQTYDIIATDSAGNSVNERGYIFVNPYAYFSFNFSGNLLKNFTLGGITFNNQNYANFTLYGDVINGTGNKTLEWSKFGYITQNISFTITNTSIINTTYNVSQSVINVNIRDKNNLSLITGTNFTLRFIPTNSSVGAEVYTTTGQAQVKKLLFQNDEYTLFVNNHIYEAEVVYFDFSNQENLTVDVYMIETGGNLTGYINLFCFDIFGRGLDGATLEALQWDSNTSSFIRVSEKKADYTGGSVLNIVLNSQPYRFKCNYQGTTGTIGDFNIPYSKNGESYTITLETEGLEEKNYLTKGLTYSASNSTNGDLTRFELEWTNEAGTSLEGCIDVYSIDNVTYRESLVSNSCTTTDSGSVIKDFDLNNITKTYVIKATLNVSNQIIIVDYWAFYPDTDVSVVLKNYYIYKWILPILVMIAVGIIFIGGRENNKEHNGYEYLGASIIILAFGFGVRIVPSIITIETFIYVTLMVIITMIAYSRGGVK